MKATSNKLMAVDLDNTYVQGNTLHLYIKEGLKRAKLPQKVAIAAFLALRRMRLISHQTMKFGCIRNINADDTILHSNFTSKIHTLINPTVLKLINEFDGTVIIASAAPDIYIPWIWERDFLATASTNNLTKSELRGEAKAKAVTEYAHKNNLIIDTVITDHSDDIPMMQLPGARVFLINPTAKTLSKLPVIQNLTILQ